MACNRVGNRVFLVCSITVRYISVESNAATHTRSMAATELGGVDGLEQQRAGMLLILGSSLCASLISVHSQNYRSKLPANNRLFRLSTSNRSLIAASKSAPINRVFNCIALVCKDWSQLSMFWPRVAVCYPGAAPHDPKLLHDPAQVRGCDHLHIKLSYLECEFNSRDFNFLRAISKSLSGLRHLHRLTALDLSAGCCHAAITDVALEPITHCTQLRRLQLGGEIPEAINWRVSDFAFRSILRAAQQSLTQLQANNFMSLQHAGMMKLNCPRLTNLQLRCCHGLTDIGVDSISRACRNLKVLDLSFLQTDSDDRPPLNRACIRSITQHCTLLTWLDISEAMQLTDPDVAIATANLPHLLTLVMEFCLGIGKAGHSWIEGFAASSPLQFLQVDQVDRIDNTVVTRIAERLSNLQYLSMLSECSVLNEDEDPREHMYTRDHMGLVTQQYPDIEIKHDFASTGCHYIIDSM